MKKILLLMLLFLFNFREITTSGITITNNSLIKNNIKENNNLYLFSIDSIIKRYNNNKNINYVEKIENKIKISNKKNKNIVDTIKILKKQISPYDSLIKLYSLKYNIDWHLCAALIYQESRFKTNLTSRRGAWGLGQFMPATMKFLGITKKSTTEQQIEAVAKYLAYLNTLFHKQIPYKKERMKFVLASYNAGHGHIFDARRIALKYNKNPYVWFNNVEICLLQKSKPEIYNDTTIVRNGYFTGIETTNFVKQIIERQKKYKSLNL